MSIELFRGCNENCRPSILKSQLFPPQIEDQMLDPILTISVVDGDPSVAPEPYAFLHLDLTYLPRGQPKEEWTVMEMIPGYVEPPPPTPVQPVFSIILS